MFELDPALKTDPRFKLYPEWIQRQVAQQPTAANPGGGGDPRGGSGKMVLDIMKAGGLVVAGTDTPNAVNLHGELMAYTMAGMSPFDALKTATVNPAKALNLNAGTIEAGKLADLIMLDGDPLADIANTVEGQEGDGQWPALRGGSNSLPRKNRHRRFRRPGVVLS